jgi:probable F420-dependent oxidoreductase
MQIGLCVPQLGTFADGHATAAVARDAEAAGFSSLWAIDRLLIPVAPRSAYPATPDGALPAVQRRALDPIVTLATAAAVTERIRVGTDVLVAPWYPPALLARSLATLDRLSGGRLDVGLGIGWSVDEYEAVGVPTAGRGDRLEEVLDVLAALWGEEPAELVTSRERIAPATLGVRPVQQPGPTILLAAFTPAGLERAGRRADGWFPAGLPLDAIEPMWRIVRQTAEYHGRDPGALRLVVRSEPTPTPTSLGAGRPPFTGSRQQVADDIQRVRDLGAHELVLDVQGASQSADELLDLALDLAGDTVRFAA